MATFNSYVKLPEGSPELIGSSQWHIEWTPRTLRAPDLSTREKAALSAFAEGRRAGDDDHRLKIEEGILCVFAIAKYYLDPTLTPGGLTPKGTSVYVQEQHESWLPPVRCAVVQIALWDVAKTYFDNFSSGWQKRRMASSRRWRSSSIWKEAPNRLEDVCLDSPRFLGVGMNKQTFVGCIGILLYSLILFLAVKGLGVRLILHRVAMAHFKAFFLPYVDDGWHVVSWIHTGVTLIGCNAL